MKKMFPLFLVVLMLVWAWGLWYYYNQPIETGPVVQNWSNQNPATEQMQMASTWLVNFIARGTEPFWYVEFSGSEMIWQSPWTTWTNTVIYSGVTQTTSWTSYILNWGDIMTTISQWACSDGMSEVVYTGNASVIISTWMNQWVYTWCANW